NGVTVGGRYSIFGPATGRPIRLQRSQPAVSAPQKKMKKVCVTMLAASNTRRFWSTLAKTWSAAANNAAKTTSSGAAMTMPAGTDQARGAERHVQPPGHRAEQGVADQSAGSAERQDLEAQLGARRDGW